jgi:hypothetical protein
VKENGFLNLHHFDMIQILRSALDSLGERIDLSFLENPRLRPGNNAFWRPAGERPLF